MVAPKDALTDFQRMIVRTAVYAEGRIPDPEQSGPKIADAMIEKKRISKDDKEKAIAAIQLAIEKYNDAIKYDRPTVPLPHAVELELRKQVLLIET